MPKAKASPKRPVRSNTKTKKTNIPTPKHQMPKRGIHPLLWLSLLFALILAAFTAYAWFKPLNLNAANEVINVKKGETFNGLIAQLAQENKLDFADLVKLYRLLFIHSPLKAGAYKIEQGTSAAKLLNMLAAGKGLELAKVTLIEGDNLSEFLTQLQDSPLITHSIGDTLTTAQKNAVLGDAATRYTSLEGLLAPDTYFFGRQETDINILKHLYQTQQQRLNTAWNNRASGLPFKNAYEALILASIVEKETGHAKDRARIASVFINRLQQNMRLQTDPTVIYGMGKQYKGNLRRIDMQTPSAYNTYIIMGLPPTPISMPSKASIEAVLHPDNRGELYFVASADADGTSVFSKTLAAHNLAVQQYVKAYQQKFGKNTSGNTPTTSP